MPTAEVETLLESGEPQTFQDRVSDWVERAFGQRPEEMPVQRVWRFLEEALEFAQSSGCTREEAQQLLDRVFARPEGEQAQELGGTLLTLAAAAQAFNLDLLKAGEAELSRVNHAEVLMKCRTKAARATPNSPLPGDI